MRNITFCFSYLRGREIMRKFSLQKETKILIRLIFFNLETKIFLTGVRRLSRKSTN